MAWPTLKPFCIGGEADPYLKRWYVLPRNRWFCIYLHQMLRDDDDRALHDHPRANISIILKGGYWEMLFRAQPAEGEPLPIRTLKRRKIGHIVFRPAALAHRLMLPYPARPSWSLFIVFRKYRDWGFWCPQGRWVPWQEFTAGPRGELVGKGCDP